VHADRLDARAGERRELLDDERDLAGSEGHGGSIA
jgi:hypothetical protein